MKRFLSIKHLSSLLLLISISGIAQANSCPDLLTFVKRKLNSQETVNLCDAYKGKTVLFVNTASYCGFTKQFTGLEALYSEYKDDGLMILGFPSHSFNQEADDEVKTGEICQLTYGVKFPMFETISVKGDDVDPLYRMLAKKSGQTPEWNFYKYLMDKNGQLVEVYPSKVKPSDEVLVKDIEAALAL